MAKKPAKQYVCSNCGYAQSSWSGKCPNCGEWNTLEEQLSVAKIAGSVAQGTVLPTQAVDRSVAKDQKRLATDISEIDDVFGGGIVPGSINLIAGQPGIGKSTLLLQLAYAVATKVPVLYISGEESAHQVGLRAERLGTLRSELKLATSTSADDIAATIATGKYKLVIVDSIQAVSANAVSSAAGTVSQITNSTQLVTLAAKQSNTAVILVGHVTKEGSIAGPKVLEHAVDVVLQLEGDRYGGFKLLRAVKNRFGSTNEAGIFEMVEQGLKPVDNPSAALLAERHAGADSDGSIVLATVEGTRPILVEVQALVNRTSYGYPKRAASGFDLNRLNLLVAMLERRTKLRLGEHDIYINIVGGIQIREPAADLAVCLAIGSAAKGLQIKQNAVVFGEVGLSGEVRHVPYVEKRLAEAKKLGFEGAIGPKARTGKQPTGLHGVPDVRGALNQFLEKD
ncbi:MAG TPA: DNA repair protein RadA [Candidatus Saccharimonadales bacterium]|nr:DNA repair protein RadA [Candidatus Saccharimonadales bacterium]